VSLNELPEIAPGELLPSDPAAEQAALGSALVSQRAALWLVKEVSAEDFYEPAHRSIFQAIATVLARGEPVDVVTVGVQLRMTERDDERARTLAVYVLGLPRFVPLPQHVGRYAGIVREKADRRRAIAALAECTQGMYQETMSADEVIGKLLPLKARRPEATADLRAVVGPYHDWLTTYLHEDPAPEVPLLGIPGLDAKLGGLGREQIVVVKAEEKVGKTTLLRQSLLETARELKRKDDGGCVLLYHLEGTLTSWLTGAVAYLGRVDRNWLRHGAFHEESDTDALMWQKITAALAELDALPIRCNDRLRGVGEITADVLYQQAETKGAVRGVWIDYLQKLRAPGANKTECVMAASDGLIDLQKRVGCPIITASQVTRQETGEKRTFYAASVQQDSSLVLQLERGPEDCINPDDMRRSSQARIVNTHSREHDAVSPTKLTFVGEFARFEET
jgi:replicative DNA helicase